MSGAPREPFVVRDAVPGDARAIAAAHVAAWRAAYRGHMPDAWLDAISLHEWTARRESGLRDPHPDARTFVVEDVAGGGVTGFAVTGPPRGSPDLRGVAAGELWAIYVAPAAWGGGLGRALLGRALADLRARGRVLAVLWVLDANARARRFYERAGFACDGATKTDTFGGAAVTEVRYRIALACPDAPTG